MSFEKIDPIFSKTVFSKLAATPKQLPQDGRPQILMAGKSNAGKSSLINKLCRQKKLARTSSSAGKTRALIFFDVQEQFYLVDLPGYGFSKSSKQEQEAFSKLTDTYLRSNSPIALIIHILDARHLPGTLDLEMIHWLEQRGVPYLILLNKSDKLSRNQQAQMRRKIKQYIEEELGFEPQLLSVSAETGQGLLGLSEIILETVNGLNDGE